MTDLHSLPCRDGDGHCLVVVEAPRGSAVKLRFDPNLRAFVLQRALKPGTTYPYDWGFVPSTLAEDGDPLDAMILYDAPTWPGVVVPTMPIGILRMRQKEGDGPSVDNDRLLGVPADDPRIAHVSDLPTLVREGLEEFFVSTSEMTGKSVTRGGWDGPKAARRAIDRAAERFRRVNGG